MQPNSVTQLLQDWRSGQGGALERLTPLVYDELHKLARKYMRNERNGHTLQPTAIVNEAYMRLIDMKIPWEDRAHFFAVAARLMRRILVDYAKQRNTGKRGSGSVTLFRLEDHDTPAQEPGFDILEIDDALTKLAASNERLARIVEVHYFAGMSAEETAEAFNISIATLHRELRLAKAWLLKAMKPRNA
jgi:RNA polymerase sigma factor (TIGR02999 family)